ncbi:hypothetical protein JG688_00003207, partial [Phytophthora aleatoria]
DPVKIYAAKHRVPGQHATTRLCPFLLVIITALTEAMLLELVFPWSGVRRASSTKPHSKSFKSVSELAEVQTLVIKLRALT